MTQVHDAADFSLFRATTSRAGFLGRVAGACLRHIRVLLTDGLVADAFLVLDGHESVAVLLRRNDGYVLVARSSALAPLDGGVHAEAEFARNAASRALARTVTLSPVWYS